MKNMIINLNKEEKEKLMMDAAKEGVSMEEFISISIYRALENDSTGVYKDS